MKLNVDILYENLSGVMEIQQYGYRYKEMNLSRPIFYDGISNFESNNVYITTTDLLPEYPIIKNGTVIICLGSKIPKEYFNDRCALLVLNNSVSIYKVFNTIQKIYDKYDEWDYKLQKIVKENGNLNNLLEESRIVFENPIMIVDKELQVLACTSEYEKDKVLKRDLSITDFNVYKDAIKNNDRKNKESYIYRYLNYDSLIYNVFKENENLCTLAIRGDYIRPLREGDRSLLYHLKKYVIESLGQYHKILSCKNHNMKDIILNLLEGKTLSSEQLMELTNEKEENNYIFLKCKLENDDDIIVPTKYASIQANSYFPDSITLVYNDIFLVFINITSINRKKLESNIIEYLRSLGYKGGVSNEFTNILEVRDYFFQACSAIEIGSKYDQKLRVYYFEDYVNEYIISMITKEIPAGKICSKELLKLADYDTIHNTDYFNELSLYIDNKMNAVHTAKKLFIHRNTFLAHLENINKIIDLDLEDPDERLYIQLSFKLLKSKRLHNEIQICINN